MFKSNSFLFIICFSICFSCKKKSDTPKFHHEYFPMEEGRYIEYEITNIKHVKGVLNPIVKITKVKTVIGDTVIDNSGRVARKFYRYLFDEQLQEYKVKDLWTCIIDQERAELVEENQRIIKLVFAPTSSKEWDKNAFNSFEKTNLYYNAIHKAYTYNNFNFDSTLVVEEDSTYNFIQYKRKYEVYAKGVGMIRKFYQDFTISNGNYLTPVEGEEIFYKILSFGKL